ncbi:hypothetical protein [Cupriavidus lacunae]|uniref:Uncharacterized protein n=1 Tax=Cupriavidus lacunae TaxID=2666307 RepID=A0A370NKR6_9BURK|nr:hypothetical protein [Cupriavidus lacunae]RDK06192.1 hypothetical protein DN412_32700 [Cupriavidus lacunae]
MERPAARAAARTLRAARLQPAFCRGVHASRRVLRMLGAGHATERRAAAQAGGGSVADLQVR